MSPELPIIIAVLVIYNILGLKCGKDNIIIINPSFLILFMLTYLL
ncbi:hypothetical protein KL86DYS1_11007 [uncultured Dysgonomonas sp.]|uniref:Uncharacterized protein n=1 Tax=uncultured Dysgonomonas sp. TaxID=206096 RepID=A0A212J3C7_9BACT|nr:hypothetical protein KL86DYS1_11007 [uncultured Dysgonomonas sp.]